MVFFLPVVSEDPVEGRGVILVLVSSIPKQANLCTLTSMIFEFGVCRVLGNYVNDVYVNAGLIALVYYSVNILFHA